MTCSLNECGFYKYHSPEGEAQCTMALQCFGVGVFPLYILSILPNFHLANVNVEIAERPRRAAR